MNSFWDNLLWGNTIHDWTVAASVIVGSLVALRVIRYVVLARLKKIVERSKTKFDDLIITVLQGCVMPLLYCLAIYFGLQYLSVNARVQQLMHVAIMVISTFFIIRTVTSVISYFVQGFIRSQAAEETKRKQARGILVIVQTFIWLAGLIFWLTTSDMISLP